MTLTIMEIYSVSQVTRRLSWQVVAARTVVCRRSIDSPIQPMLKCYSVILYFKKN